MSTFPRSLAFLLLVLLLTLVVLAPGPARAFAGAEGLRSWPEAAVLRADSWHDTQGSADLAQAQARFAAGDSQPFEAGSVAPTGQGGAVWFRLVLPAVDQPREAVLEIPHPGIDRVDLYRPAPEGGWLVRSAGDALPVAAWPEPYLHPVFHFTLQPGASTEAWLRVQNVRSTGVSWVLRDEVGFSIASRQAYLLVGVLFGLLALVTWLSVFNAWSWRDPLHLLYALHTLCVGAVVVSATGVAGVFLWPQAPLLNDRAGAAMPLLGLATLSSFVLALVHERGMRWPSVGLVALAGAHLGLGVAVLALGRPRGGAYAAIVALSLATLLLILGVLAWHAWKHRRPGSAWIAAGVGLLMLGAIPLALRTLGAVPISSVTQYGLSAAWLLEAPLMLAGLYFRSRHLRDQRLRLQSLAHADPLTGVATPAVLLRRLQRVLRAAALDPGAGAVLRVRIGNLDAIRTEHGREAAEAAIVRAAECLANEVGPHDTLAREPGGDFVLVLAGRLSVDRVTETGRSVIARGLKFTPRLPPSVVLKLQVVVLVPPLPPETPHEVLAQLDEALVLLAARREPPALRVLGVDSGGAGTPSGPRQPDPWLS